MSMALPTAQKKGWCFTYNNYGPGTDPPSAPADIFNRLEGHHVFVVLGKEVCPSTGTRHLQGYVLFSDRKRFKTVKSLIGAGAHIEPAKGSPLQNYNYCSKEGDVETRGTLPKGKHTALSVVCEELKAGVPLRTIAVNEPEVFVRNHNGLQKLVEILAESTMRNWKTHVTVLVGPTGTGKSRWAFDVCSKSAPYYKPRGEWWNGYTTQSHVIIDDFYGWLPFDELFRITDRYPHRVPIKGGYSQFLARKIIITSNRPVENWYPNISPDLLDALKRRIELYYLNEIPTNKTID